jgi:Domain of unknown function (DUF3854)
MTADRFTITGRYSGVMRHHAEQLDASAIEPHVVQARHYTSIPREHDAEEWLRSTGFASGVTGPRMPGLVIPLWGVDGRRWGWQYKPNSPRKDGKGKVRKYEQPMGQDSRLDVNPLMVEHLRDRARPIWVTEGAKKVDAATSADLVCIGLTGVSAWRTPDWNEVKLSGRLVFIAFDSDAVSNPAVATQERKLARVLRSMGADVRVMRIPPTADGGKQGLDDYLAAGGSIEELTAGATEAGMGGDTPDDRPALDVTNPADLADLLRADLGSGPTSGLFDRADQLVHVPRVGEDGYF